MAKRTMSKASKRRLTVFGTISVVAIFYFIISLIYNVYIIYDLSLDKKELLNKLDTLKEEAEQLKLDIDRLSDQEYLADYAREKYLYSKEGEYIIQIGEEYLETTETIDSIDLGINKNYLLVGLSFIIFLIFIYILTKGKNKK